MRVIAVTDRNAGTAGMKLLERPVPQAAINDVVVQLHEARNLAPLPGGVELTMGASLRTSVLTAWRLPSRRLSEGPRLRCAVSESGGRIQKQIWSSV